MTKQLTYNKKAMKGLRKMPAQQTARMIAALENIAAGQIVGLDIKKLQNRSEYRLRIGQYRAIYDDDMNVINVTYIGPRGGAYN